MSKEKQIGEMVELFLRNTPLSTISCEDLAELMYDSGYRKASKVAREIFEEIWEMFIPEKSAAGCAYYFDMYELAELKNKYTEGNNG